MSTMQELNHPVLSLCIPVFNRAALFEQSLKCAVEAVSGYEGLVEVVVSDNASTEPIYETVRRLASANPEVCVRYSRLPENRGAAANIIEVVRRALGEFCWIVGSDDFVLSSGVRDVLGILRKHPNIDFVSVGCGSVDLSKACAGGQTEDIADVLRNNTEWPVRGNASISKATLWDELVDSKFHNVLLNKVMMCVFRRKLWMAVSWDEGTLRGPFSNIRNTYPHCYVFSRAFVGRHAWYHGKACLVVGSGAREWSTDSGCTIWESYLPLIFLKLFDEIVNEYAQSGLQSRQVRRCRRDVGVFVGRWIGPYLIHRYVFGGRVKGGEGISGRKALALHWTNIRFYEGVARWLFSPARPFVRHGWLRVRAIMTVRGRTEE